MSLASNPPIKFGTDGWRGIIADNFTFANVCKVTRAIAAHLERAYSAERPVLVGYDTRFLADEFARTAAEVLAELGWSVRLVARDCPTPVMAHAAQDLGTAGALMFTASHNPPPYCGIKYIPDYAGPATTEITNAIVDNIASSTEDPPSGDGSARIARLEPQADYLQSLYAQLDCARIRSARLSVKYDALYSTSRGYMDRILSECGCEVETFNAWRDVLFGGGMPEPKEAQLRDLADAVRRDGADLGLATDGDGDRFGVMDESGELLTPNTVLLLLAHHLVKNKGQTGAIVRTVATTHLLDRLASAYGLEAIETPVGFKYVGEQMRQRPVLIGGEESGGLSVIGHIPEKDGILANMLVAEAMAYEGKPLSQLVEEVLAKAGGPAYNQRLDLELDDARKRAAMEHFRHNPPSELAGIAVRETGHQDGVKLYLEEGSWVLLRPSGTEPLMRVYIESDTQAKQTQLAERVQAALQQIEPVAA